MPKITIISPYFFPDIASNVALIMDLAEDLCKNDNKVRLVSFFSPNRKKKENMLKIRKGSYKGCDVIKYPNPFLKKKGLFFKFMESLVDYFWAIYISLRWQSDTDVFFIQSTPPLVALPVSLFLFKKIPIIYNIQDIFPDSAISAGLLKNKLLIKIFRLIEKITYKRIDVAAVISLGFKEHILNVSPKTRVEVIPNWVDTKKIRYIRPEKNELFNKLGINNNHFIVLYAGNLGYAQNLEIILEAAYLLKSYTNILFLIIGDGQYKTKLEEKIRSKKLTNLVLAPMQPIEMISNVYSLASVAIVTVKRGVDLAAVPSKTWTILACERPLIACVTNYSELGDIILKNNLGLVVPPDNGEKLSEAILSLYNNESLRKLLSFNGINYVRRFLDRKIMTDKYNQIIIDLIK